MIQLYRSNRMEALADALAGVVDAPVVEPLAPEHVVVPSPGLAQWLGLALAARRGVLAHVLWWQPRQLVEHVLALCGAVPDEAWSRDRLAWAVLAELDGLVEAPGFEELRPWLRAAPDAAGRMQLARRVAHLFDQYAVYRPERVLGWSRGEEDGWQPALWRRLEARWGAGHLAAVAAKVDGASALPAEGLPERVSLLGLTTLPPLFLQVLGWLGERVPVHLLQLSPTEAWWADTSSPRQIRRHLAGRTPGAGPEAEAALHLERGHALLSTLGGVGRDFQRLVEDAFPYHEDDVDRFVPSGRPTVLGILQDDLLALRERAPGERLPLPVDDPSFRVVGAHGPVREVEILRDEILAMLRADPTLQPSDVLVLMPDVTVHGPLVDAVFGVDPSDPAWLPYVVADRPVAQGSEVARALLGLVALVGGRLGAPEVLDLLSLSSVRSRFGLVDADAGDLEELVRGIGIRWAADANHRAAEGQPAVEVHTWRFGLDRLVLGHAIASDVPVAGVVPWPHVEGDAATRIGCFVDFAEHVLGWRERLAAPRSAGAWAEELVQVARELFGADDARYEELRQVERVLGELAAHAAAAEVHAELPLALVRDHLETVLGSERRQGAFLRGGVTFCEMLPMRSVPARVVCLLGLSDGAFPRADTHLGFDLLRQQPKAGDRSLRADDRYLVLEALLSARDAVRVTYVSRSVKDNAPQPPSVVLSDLLDALDATFLPPEGRASVREALVVEHPLQPFSPRYVTGPAQLCTFDASNDAAARALLPPPEPEPAFLSGPVPPSEIVKEVDVDQLVRFFRDPVLWFLTQRLGVGSVGVADALPEREPLEVDGLDRHHLGERLLTLRRRGLSWDVCAAVARGEGLLPLGSLDATVLGRLCAQVDGLLREAGARLAEPLRPPVLLELDLVHEGGPVRLVGRVDDLRQGARVEIGLRKFDGRSAHQVVGPWIRHLALCAAGSEVRRTELFLVRSEDAPGVGPVAALRPVEPAEAADRLHDLVQLYLRGHEQPLPFLPEASWPWVAFGSAEPVRLASGAKAARLAWERRADAAGAWQRLLGGEAVFVHDPDAPLGFTALAERVLAPLRGALEGG